MPNTTYEGTIHTSTPNLASQPFFIAKEDGGQFDGNIDDVGLWNIALSAPAVSSIYNSGVPADLTSNYLNYDKSSNLIGYWKFQEGSGTSVVNTANSGTNDGTLVNSPTWSTDVPPD